MNNSIIGKIILLVLIIYFAFTLICFPDNYIIIDNFNFFIHEIGHIIAIPFGQTVHIIAGSFFQLLVPIIFLFYFLKTNSEAGLAFCIFWVGNNFINVSRYAKDARAMQLELLFGDIHDWNWMLTQWNLLEKDILIGNVFFTIGTILMILSIIFLIFFILREIKWAKNRKQQNILSFKADGIK